MPGPAAGQNVVAPAAAAEDNSDWEWELSEDYKNGWPRDFKRTGPRYPGSADHVSTDPVRTVPVTAPGQTFAAPVAPATPTYRDNTQHSAEATKKFAKALEQRAKEAE